MSTDLVRSLSELELDVLWTVYEGHSLVIERPVGDEQDDRAHVVMSIAYDEADEAVAEVAEIPLDTVERLIDLGFLTRSDDGPVLDAHDWFDDELGVDIRAEEYLLSDLGQSVIDDTASPEQQAAGDSDEDGWDDEDEDDEDDEDDGLDDEDDFDDDLDGELDDEPDDSAAEDEDDLDEDD